MAYRAVSFTKGKHIGNAIYDPETKVLRVIFSKFGDPYLYKNVSEEDITNFAASPQPWIWLYKNLRGKNRRARDKSME